MSERDPQPIVDLLDYWCRLHPVDAVMDLPADCTIVIVPTRTGVKVTAR